MFYFETEPRDEHALYCTAILQYLLHDRSLDRGLCSTLVRSKQPKKIIIMIKSALWKRETKGSSIQFFD